MPSPSPTKFETELPLPTAIERLQKMTVISGKKLPRQDAVVGTVSEDGVVLHRSNPYSRNSFQPYFKGQFQVTHQKLELHGTFHLHWSVRLFMVLWLGFGTLWICVACIHALRAPSEFWWLPLPGVALLSLAAGVVKLGKSIGRSDEAIIAEKITAAFKS